MSATSNVTTTQQQLADGNAAGTVVGQSATDLVGFHGATPTAQGAAITLTSGTLGDTNTAVLAIIALLETKGLAAL